MIRVFWEWWVQQLWDLVPAAWRRKLAASESGNAVVLTLSDTKPGQRPGVDVLRRRNRREAQLGRFVLDETGLATLRTALGQQRRGPIRLVLPPGLLLEQQVTLPLAAERGLDTALHWEMDRLTPFPAEAVFWSWQVEQRDRARGRLLLRVRLVPKVAVAAILDALAAFGLSPTLLASAADPAAIVPLSGPARADRRARAQLAGACFLFALALAAAVAAPFVRQEFADRRLAEHIEAMRPDVDLAEGLRRRLDERAASADVVAAEAARVGNALRILAAITDVLPDDTSLFSITLRDRALTFTGQSAAAARLIPALAADPAFRDPVFAAPVTRNEFTGAEAFTIRTELRP